MTREQQKKLRELKQALPKILKSSLKQYNFKKIDYMVWGKKDDVYFSLFIFVREVDGHCHCSSRESIKPLWMDDLFWDIMDMSENKSQPLSLRCIGAFTVHGMKAYEDKQELPEWSPDELEKCVVAYLEHFDRTVKSSDMESYYSLFDPTAYHGEIQEILILIHRQEYEKALECIHAIDDGGGFANKGIDFKEYAEVYCKERL